MMHESKGQHIGKAPSLHLFHTTVRQCMGVFLKCTSFIGIIGMKLKPCHVFINTIISLHGMLVTYLWYKIDPELQTGHYIIFSV